MSNTPETDAAWAQKELSSIHRWIERNHPDGFIDSLTYFQNLDRITENWYDRLDRLEVDAGRFEKERDEARRELEKIKETKQELMQMVYGRNWLEQDLLKKIDTWRKYAEKLAIYLRAFAPYSNLSEGEKKLLAEFDQLKEGGE